MSTPPPIGMSAPPPPPPPPPPSSARKGCFIAVAVALVVLLIACIAGFMYMRNNAGKLMAKGLDAIAAQSSALIAPGVPDETKAAFTAEMTAYGDWLRAATKEDMEAKGPAAVAPLQNLQTALQDKSLDADEMQRFIEVSRQFRGVPVEPPPAPAPVEPAPAEPAAPTEGAAPAEGTAPAAPAEGSAPAAP